MKLDDEKRKSLTKYLGECWHTIIPELLCCRCGAKGPSANRTFIVDTDMMALFRKMVDEEELDNFLFWCSVTHLNFPPKIENLFYKPERFCNLVAKWLEVKK